MDEALRAHLEAMESRAAAREAATRQDSREQTAAAEQRATARDAATRQDSREQTAAADQRALARDAAARQELREEISAVDGRSVARDEVLRDDIAAVREELAASRREARVMHESIIREIRTLGEGLTTRQDDQIRRALDQRDQAIIHDRVAPLEASAANHEKRITELEQRA